MSEDNTNVQEEEIKTVDINTEDGFAQAHEQCKAYLGDVFMKHPTTGDPMIIVVPPQLQQDGTLTFVCSDKADAEEGVAFMIMTAPVNISKDVEIVAPDGGIVDADGKPISSETGSAGIIGLDGRPLA